MPRVIGALHVIHEVPRTEDSGCCSEDPGLPSIRIVFDSYVGEDCPVDVVGMILSQAERERLGVFLGKGTRTILSSWLPPELQRRHFRDSGRHEASDADLADL